MVLHMRLTVDSKTPEIDVAFGSLSGARLRTRAVATHTVVLTAATAMADAVFALTVKRIRQQQLSREVASA